MELKTTMEAMNFLGDESLEKMITIIKSLVGTIGELIPYLLDNIYNNKPAIDKLLQWCETIIIILKESISEVPDLKKSEASHYEKRIATLKEIRNAWKKDALECSASSDIVSDTKFIKLLEKKDFHVKIGIRKRSQEDLKRILELWKFDEEIGLTPLRSDVLIYWCRSNF